MEGIDRTSPVPYYVQLYDLLLHMIQGGELEPGSPYFDSNHRGLAPLVAKLAASTLKSRT